MEKVDDHRQAIEEQRCFIFYAGHVDEWFNYSSGKKFSCKEILLWIKDAPDINIQTLPLLSTGVPKFALIFEDSVYAKIFGLRFNVPLETVLRD